MRIGISGYQVIKDAELVIDGITMVTGSNNHGKSSIIRAAESCLFSEQGDDFINDEMGVVQVRMIFESEGDFPDADIAWQKGRGTGAVYKINGERYSKERGKPPLEEMSNLGFREITVRDKKQRLYFWRLHDGLFMVVDHPSYIFGFISNLMEHEKIVPVLKDMAKEGDEVKSRLKEIEAKCEVYEQEIENTKLAEEQLKEIIENHENDIQMIEDGVSMLRGLEIYSSNLFTHNQAIDYCMEQISILSEKVPDKKLLGKIQESLNWYNFLVGSREELNQRSTKISSLSHVIKVLDSKKVSREDLTDLGEAIKRLGDLKALKARLLVYANNIQIVLEEISREERNLMSQKKSFEKMKKELGVCPLCGKEF